MLAAVFLALGISSVASAKVIYVDDDATGTYDGANWENAYNFLQDALMMASSGDEIRVAQGIYKPDRFILSDRPSRGREETYQLINGVTLKGGYAGFGMPDPNARDTELYESILSGDLGGNDVHVTDPCDLPDEPTRAENSYHVVTGSGTDATAMLDGFAITGGNDDRYLCPIPELAEECMQVGSGGGMYNIGGSPTVRNCTFEGNSAFKSGIHGPPAFGGGMYNYLGSNPRVVNCTFRGNFSGMGGGLYNGNSTPIVENCTFAANGASDMGAGMVNSGSSPTLTNCTFSVNTGGNGGGVGDYSNANPVLTNCVFNGNTVEHRGGGMVNDYNCNPALTDCLFTGNSAVEGGAICNLWDSSPTLIGCTFRQNSGSRGGAISTQKGAPLLSGCLFVENSASNGGALYYDSYSGTIRATVTNSAFAGNSATGSGGASYCYAGQNSELTFMNCSFSGNSAAAGGAVYNRQRGQPSLAVKILRCILWGDAPDEIQNEDGPNVSVTYSDVQGDWSGKGNINSDPCFADPANGDCHVKSQAGRWDPNSQTWVQDDVTSPCIDAGEPMAPIGHEPFPNGGIVNVGAYGGTAEASKSYFGKPLCETIVAGDVNGDCVVDFRDFFFIALHWLEER